MSTYIQTWDCCDSETRTRSWIPEECPFCTPDPAGWVAAWATGDAAEWARWTGSGDENATPPPGSDFGRNSGTTAKNTEKAGSGGTSAENASGTQKHRENGSGSTVPDKTADKGKAAGSSGLWDRETPAPKDEALRSGVASVAECNS